MHLDSFILHFQIGLLAPGSTPVGSQQRHFVRIMGITLAILNVVGVGVLALWKATSMSASDRLPWAEVVYGPAITVISCFLLFLIAAGIERLIGARKGRR
jgi:hypothetical protein